MIQTRRPRRARLGLSVASLSAILLAAGACAQGPAAAVAPSRPSIEMRIAQGPIRGVDEGDVLSFKNIPYAAPPIGDLRWRAPRPAPRWTEVRDASAYGDDCIQARPMWDDTQTRLPVSEDCLSLNVWTPKTSANGPAPVIVWIHGGGFVMGSGSQPIFDGARLAARGAVVVTFNYRLGRFGFFSHPALTAEAGAEPTGNYGLMDQVAALKWVHANITALGGDPARVTIMGQSAGGGSVLQLMNIPQAQGLFHRSIVQSGGGRDHWPALRAPDDARSGESVGVAFASAQNLRNATVADLRAIPADKVKGRLDLLTPEKDTYSGPIIDGRFVTAQVMDAFRRGAQSNVPMIIGATDLELGVIPAAFRGLLADRTMEDTGVPRESLLAVYGDRNALNTHMPSELTFIEPARRLAALGAEKDRPVWLYSFGYVQESKRRDTAGAGHSTDTPYSFDTLDRVKGPFTEADQRIATAMADYWVAFARDGRPDAAGQTPWPRYDARADQALLLGNTGVTVGAPPQAARLNALGLLRDRLATPSH
ncbi:carboxylesterase family protein [uncultured Brevundimonas sp.]|uniref:carboxylesterase/lipase family protein n=1 Tax=uncultured Brevundimonas sp. TaxID=213418 RepID=UPI0025DE031E|nr:carboxylesterase family protein [uncultured Brevundimonas sp.]